MHVFRGLQNSDGCHWSDEFQKYDVFFLEKRAPGNFGAPGCHPSTLIDPENTALDSRRTVETIWMISNGYKDNSGVSGSMNLKKIWTFFFRKFVLQGFWGP